MPKKGSKAGVSPEVQARRERALLIRSRFHDFLDDVAHLAGAHNPPFDHVEPAVADALRQAARPFIEEYSCRTDWGEMQEFWAEGLDTGGVVKVMAKVHCRSQAMDHYGRYFPAEDTVWRLSIWFSPTGETVIGVRFDPDESEDNPDRAVA